MEDSVEIDAKRILLRYGMPIAVLDKMTEEERIRLAHTIVRTALADREVRLRDLLLETGHSSDDPSGLGADGPVQYLYYIVHKDNIASVLANGALLCRSRARKVGIPTDIAYPDVIQRRSAKIDPIQRRRLHDYVNLYFRARNPMLFVRRELQLDLAVLYVDGRLLREPHVLFTDGNAASGTTRFFDNLADLKELDWDCLKAVHWNNYDDGKRKRCAEVLVPGSVPLSRVERAVVNNEPLRDELTRLDWPTPVDIRPDWFF